MKNYILRYLKCPTLFIDDHKNDVKLAYTSNGRGCIFEGKNKLYPASSARHSAMGLGSYIGPQSHLDYCKIGRYCSIGPEVSVIAGTHPVGDFVSTHPCFYSTRQQAGFSYVKEQKFKEFIYADAHEKWVVEIGSDVWIGTGVKIVGGIRIGIGAIIASGSVVTKDVGDYEVVGGVPAKHIKYRFNESIRTKLLEEKWWEKEEEWLLRNIDRFTNPIKNDTF